MAAKKTVNEEIKETIEKVEETTVKAAKKVSTAAKNTAAKTTAAAKSTAAKTAKKVETVKAEAEEVAAKKPAAKKAPAKKAAEPEIFVQYQGKEVSLAALLGQVKEAVADTKADIKLYIKPEDGACYYVAGDQTGKIDF